ncbi:cytochrome-c oxidase, cbb3-type subunit III [Parvibium lacunae]|uniref:Cbb3-type cytochrome c oxidase subunit n=1 Tax=Parvibium lacunae TaxID=1888893 RepID=A0A368L3B8_9BURK|nr:cytochrome-c oxidase, cbb3-type subunit III [Parvibium lacunae]RCS58069.1 cytochrome-c oxidase, cbb3-type subunit III [Parvibium lacunae]
MADFTHSLWGTYITIVTIISILGCLWLLLALRSKKQDPNQPVKTMGHVWDETLEEYDHPLPRWWLWLFIITLVFAAVYLYLYPGLGTHSGAYAWSSAGQYEAEMKKMDAKVAPLFAKYLQQEIQQVAADPAARAMGEKLFLNYCAQCHGSDAQGSKGFPNLTDKDWLYGGDPATIKLTILNGRQGMMPPMAAAVGGEDDVRNVANYVLSLSGSAHDSIKAGFGKEKFAACAACHGADGKGNPALGAPNLSDKTWLYGGSIDTIMETINKGRSNAMPAFKERLGEAKIQVLAAYVWSLSNQESKPAQ